VAKAALADLTYKLRFKKGDFEVEAQGDKEWVEKKFSELMTKKTNVPSEENKKDFLPETLGEFLDEKGNPQRHTDVTAVYAYWLFKKENYQSFNVKDIVECYDKTRKPKPSNPNQIINTNVSSHLFAEASEKKDNLKAWVITRLGEDYVEQLK
jgi:hypothetical protein